MQRRSMRAPQALWCIFVMSCVSCVQLDGFVHNPRHCSAVSEETCEQNDDPFNKLCIPCEGDYDWSRSAPWPQGFFEGADVTALRTPTGVLQRTIETRDGEGTLDVHILPAHGETPERARISILVQHGNYGNVEHYIPRAKIFHEMGYQVILWDYRGYGKSTPDSTPTPDQLLEDARQIQALWPELSAAPEGDTDPDTLVVYGMSLGAIPSVEMVTSTQGACGLILEVPFTSLHEITKTNTGTSLGEGYLSQGEYENTEKIRAYTRPLLIFHASSDNLFPLESVQKLYDNAGSADKTLHVIEGAEHGIAEGIPETAGYAAYGDKVSTFITRAVEACR